MNEKHFFASANTYKGFINYFESIGGKFTYILKGTSGSGKSTLLKQIAKHFADKGEAVEYFHCSFDPESLDGIRLVGRDISIIDGTNPHPMESKKDGNDEIVNLVEYIEIKTEDHLKIGKLEKKKKNYFKRAIKAHSQAFQLHQKLEAIYAPYIDFDKVTRKTQDLIQDIENIE